MTDSVMGGITRVSTVAELSPSVTSSSIHVVSQLTSKRVLSQSHTRWRSMRTCRSRLWCNRISQTRMQTRARLMQVSFYTVFVSYYSNDKKHFCLILTKHATRPWRHLVACVDLSVCYSYILFRGSHTCMNACTPHTYVNAQPMHKCIYMHTTCMHLMSVRVMTESQSCLVCTARRINFPEKNVGMLGVEQFTTNQDLQGKILDCDTRYCSI